MVLLASKNTCVCVVVVVVVLNVLLIGSSSVPLIRLTEGY